MLNRNILVYFGFKKSNDKAWGHEVWYHDKANCWVHYDFETDSKINYGRANVTATFSGDDLDLQSFIELFLQAFEDSIRTDYVEVVY